MTTYSLYINEDTRKQMQDNFNEENKIDNKNYRKMSAVNTIDYSQNKTKQRNSNSSQAFSSFVYLF